MTNLIAQLVLGEHGESVESVFVGGKPIMRKRTLKTVNEKDILGTLSSLAPRIRMARKAVLEKTE